VYEVEKQTVRKRTYKFEANFTCHVPRFQSVESLSEISFIFDTDVVISPALIEDVSYQAELLNLSDWIYVADEEKSRESSIERTPMDSPGPEVVQ
jgi:hypothetical protein